MTRNYQRRSRMAIESPMVMLTGHDAVAGVPGGEQDQLGANLNRPRRDRAVEGNDWRLDGQQRRQCVFDPLPRDQMSAFKPTLTRPTPLIELRQPAAA